MFFEILNPLRTFEEQANWIYDNSQKIILFDRIYTGHASPDVEGNIFMPSA
jgi:hypothetical protein